jgi:hypothetical protein
MDRETVSKLRLDRRLSRRRGWISPDDLERELEALPDLSHKIAPPQDEEPPDAPSRSNPPARGN